MPQIYERPNIGAQLGSALGTGLGQGLQLLAQQKLNEMASRQQNLKNFNAFRLLGYPETEAQALSTLPENLQKSWLVNYGPAEGAPLTEQSTNALAGTLEAPGALQDQARGNLEEMISSLTPAQFSQLSSGLQAAGTPNINIQSSKLPVTAPQRRLTNQQLKEKKIEDYREKKLAQQEKSSAFKETKEFRKDLLEKGKAARQDLVDLERLEELEKEGKLDTPGYVEFLKRSGLDIPALMNPGSEEFNKVTANFMRNAKTYLGSRISNFELESFLKTIPNLSQSPEGRKRVIANLKRIARGSVESLNAMKEIIKENNGIPPYDLMEQVDERLDKKRDKLAAQFKEDLARIVPKAQNKLITALQAGAGSAAGLPGKILGIPGKIIGGLSQLAKGY